MSYRTALAVVLVLSVTSAAQRDGDGDWPWFGRDPGAQRYSPLTQITPDNVTRLEQAWSFDTRATDLQVTPVVVNGLMYVNGGTSVFALEPETGRQVWKFDAKSKVARRGVAYWPGDGQIQPRIYSGVGDGRLVALDAMTGQPAVGFGARGFLNLKDSIRGIDGPFMLDSPPAVYRNVMITGGSNNEQEPSSGLYGDIRGWDARTGKLLWSFHTVPRAAEPGVETWEGESWKNRSGANAWTYMTVDVDRGVVFAATGSPTSDFYGADRRGNNLYANSLIALDANTGKLRWFQQLVHHDLWDWDVPAAPTLIDVTIKGRKVAAVAQITKMSTLFIFDRVSGTPLFGMEERPVPQSELPGEATSATQPFPLQPPPLARTAFDPATDFYSLTPEHAAYCRDVWDKNHMHARGMFSPPELDRTIVMFPSTLGGGNWSGLSYDPVRALVFTNIMNLGQVVRMEKRTARADVLGPYKRTSPWDSAYARFWNPDTKVPCSAPPFGELVAIDVNRASVAWRVPLGAFDDLKARGFDRTGTPNIGGTIVTASGVIFIAASIDRRFRAFHAETGALLWETMLEASGHATPMTFMGRDQRQYVVIAAGGNGLLRSAPGRTVVAFALPAKKQTASSYKQKIRTFHTPEEFERLTRGKVRLQRQRRPLTGTEVPLRSPAQSFTVMAVESPSVTWFGTRDGAIRFSREPSSLEYFHGQRWLPADHVTGIGFDGSATWLETPKGFARIEYKPMTLEDKSRQFVDRIQARHNRWGLTADSHLKVPGDLSSNETVWSDNDGLWTAMYVSAECFRYKVTGQPDARENARRGMQAIMRLEAITGIPGFPARSFIRVGEDVQPRDGEWHDTPDKAWRWKGDTSSDEIVGHYFVYALYYDLVADEEEKPVLRGVIARITNHILDNKYQLIDLDGQRTRWGWWGPDAIWEDPDETGLRALLVLAHLRVALHMTSDRGFRIKFQAAYDDLVGNHKYHLLTRSQKVMVPGAVNHSDDELAFLAYYPLLRYETDPGLLAVYKQSLERSWQIERPERNPLWNVIYAAGTGAREFDRSESLRTLQEVPMDQVTWAVKNSHRQDVPISPMSDRFKRRQALIVLPYDELPIWKWNENPYRLDGGDGGHAEADGVYFLLPYWMGRYHRLIDE